MSVKGEKLAFHSETYRRKKELKLSREETQELFLLMYEVHKGNMTAASRAAAVSVTTIYEWRKGDPEFTARMDKVKLEAEDHRLDIAEEVVDESIEITRDGPMTRWLLDRKGRTRGYGQVVKQKHGGVNGPQIEVNIEGEYPPVPKSLEDWEDQQEQARARKAASKGESVDSE